MANRRALVLASGRQQQIPANDALECEALATTGLIVNLNGSIQTTGVGAGSVVGNARGTGAVDLQITRTAAAQVASGNYSFCAGNGNTTGGFGSFAVGAANSAQSNYAICFGIAGRGKRYGEIVQSSGALAATGDTQSTQITISGTTTSGTATVITTGSFLLPLDNDSTLYFDVKIVARRTDADNESAAFKLEGCIDRNTNAASTALVGAVTKTFVARDSASWDVLADADTTNGALRITVTGETGKTIRWAAFVRLVEVVG